MRAHSEQMEEPVQRINSWRPKLIKITLTQTRMEVDQVPELRLCLSFWKTGPDSPLSDEVNEPVAELSDGEHWRILWTQDQQGEKEDFDLAYIWFKFICYSWRHVHKGQKKKWKYQHALCYDDLWSVSERAEGSSSPSTQILIIPPSSKFYIVLFGLS